MKPRVILLGLLTLLLGILLPVILTAQRGTITIPHGATISVPMNASICADTIFANNPGYGTLTLAHPSGLCATAIVTPVELLSFSAISHEAAVHLSWTTATETRNLGFEVQRQLARNEWHTLGFIEGAGSTTQSRTYTFLDDLACLPVRYEEIRYRLKQVDLDGSYRYSQEVSVSPEWQVPQFSIRGYPTPCGDLLTVAVSISTASPVRIRLYDLSGRVVREILSEDNPTTGMHTLQVRTDNIPAGLYILVAENTEGRKVQKIPILR